MTPFFGRFFRIVTLFAAFLAVFAALPAQAAPYAAIVMDAKSGEVLFEQNADTRLHPASLTKMMTLYIAFQEIEAGRLSLDTVVTVSKHAAAQPPSRLGLRPGQKIKMRYLIRAAAIKSANDAATAIGEHIGGGSEPAFAKRMTKTARALGMRNSSFRNANGLTAEGHMSSARDMTLLGRHLFYDFPQYYNIFSRKTADAGIAQVTNTNSRFLSGYEGADGIKTGYTVPAGFNLTASAKRGDKRIIATIFGGTSTAQRNAKMVELMNLGFARARPGAREQLPPPADVPEADPAEDPVADLIAQSVTTGDPSESATAKTIRVTGAVTASVRPKARPGAEPVAEEMAEAIAMADPEAAMDPVPDAVALAIAEGVAGALAEANAPPAAENALEAQAVALATAAPEAAPAPVPPAAVSKGTAEPGSLEAQAIALAQGLDPAQSPALPETDPATDPAALAESATEDTPAATAVATLRPQPRPAQLDRAEEPTELAEAPVEALPVPDAAAPVAVAEAPRLMETPAPATPERAPEPAAIAMAEAAPAATPDPEAVTAIETVAAATEAVPEAAPSRKAPIFDSVQLAKASTEAATEERVIVTKSSSGNSQWAVNVGAYGSRSEAERGLVKAGLAESATLDRGARKVTQSGGKYRASFQGLSQDQADLACRRLRARGMSCETVSPG